MVEVVCSTTTCTTCPGLDLVGGDVVEVVCSTDYFYHVSWIRSNPGGEWYK